MQLLVPKALRKKNVSSRISREIFFIDCINDLIFCAQNGTSYHLIRSSVVLRILLLDKGLETICEPYNYVPIFLASKNELCGPSLSKSEVKKIKDTLSELKNGIDSFKTLCLIHKPLKEYTLIDFIGKVCLIIKGTIDYNFSIENIIRIVANKNGGAHLEAQFDSSNFESFQLGEFSPFSMTDGNFFLMKIREIILILVKAVYPVSGEIIKQLKHYDESINQTEISEHFHLIKTEEELKLKTRL